ncbi:MAG TPA: hypothetical protein VMC85_12330, partial [Desulfomonilaceae bacterium]|nr:hypothetical protein [Desulfomonilaceae bacterium]
FSFQSFGFVLSVPPRHSDQVIGLFHERKINASVIGKVIKESKIKIMRGSDVETLFDFTKDKITGIVYQPPSAH